MRLIPLEAVTNEVRGKTWSHTFATPSLDVATRSPCDGATVTRGPN
jgi:hypothetical protein